MSGNNRRREESRGGGEGARRSQGTMRLARVEERWRGEDGRGGGKHRSTERGEKEGRGGAKAGRSEEEGRM